MEPDPIYDTMKQESIEKFAHERDRFLSEAISADDGKWEQHTEYHWSRTVNGHRLDYWPNRSVFRYLGKIQLGNVKEFISSQEGE